MPYPIEALTNGRSCVSRCEPTQALAYIQVKDFLIVGMLARPDCVWWQGYKRILGLAVLWEPEGHKVHRH